MRIYKCKKLITELNLITFDSKKSFVETMMTNSIFKNKFKNV